MNDVTCILLDIGQGKSEAASQLLPLVYDELRKLAAQKLAREAPGQTLQATALVHDAYLRLVATTDPGWDSRGHFFAAAAEAMRRILVENARRKAAVKAGGGRQRYDVDQAEPAIAGPAAMGGCGGAQRHHRSCQGVRPGACCPSHPAAGHTHGLYAVKQ
jgi:RNA polymerase sigma factor (TIGR02999 family)